MIDEFRPQYVTASSEYGMNGISSAERLLMHGIEKWLSSTDDDWLRKMNHARAIASQRGLSAQLIQSAARIGIYRLVRTANRFQIDMYKKVQAFVKEHELAVSEVIDEMEYRILTVRAEFDLTEEQVVAAVLEGLLRHADDGGTPEVAIKLADALAIAEERRAFLQPPAFIAG